MTITNKDLFILDELIGRYVGVIPQGTSKEDAQRQIAVLDRVRKYTKFSYALGRNLSLMKPVITSVQLAFRDDHMEAFQKEMSSVAMDQSTAPEDKEVKFEEVREKYNANQLHADAAQRQEELFAMEATKEDGTPFCFYRFPVTYLPGWNDSDDLPDDERTGAVTPTDIATLMNMGILYDPSDEQNPA